MNNVYIEVNSRQFQVAVDFFYSLGASWAGGEHKDFFRGQEALVILDSSNKLRWCELKEKFNLVLSYPVLTEMKFNEINKSVNNKKTKMALKDVLDKKFVFIDDVAEILEIGKQTGKNVFLYGRGGHAKSEIVTEVLKFIDPKGNESFVQACGEGLSEEKLFGGMNLVKFQKTGEIEYLVENSFMNKKYVVFEELLDSRMNVLLSLKDILTSGIFRQGHQQFKIKTEFVICLTNRTKQEVSEDNSVKALLERFPLEQKVEWEKYESDDYQLMFNKVLGANFKEVADICTCINETGDFVSPRTAIHMAQVYKSTGRIGALKYFGASGEIITKMEKLKKDQDDRDYIANKDYLIESNEFDSDDMDSLKSHLAFLKLHFTEMTSKSYSDKVFADFAELKKRVEKSINETKELMLNLLENG